MSPNTCWDTRPITNYRVVYLLTSPSKTYLLCRTHNIIIILQLPHLLKLCLVKVILHEPSQLCNLALSLTRPCRLTLHTQLLQVYCIPAACAPALAATFLDAFAPHPGPKTSGHPAWPGATPALTSGRPHHTYAQTRKYTCTDSQTNHHSHTNTRRHILTQPRSRWGTNTMTMVPDTYSNRLTPHPPQEKKEGKGEDRNSWSTTTALLQS